MQILKIAVLDRALPIIKEFEGCRLKAYKCPAGIWTIGWGQTKGVKEGMVWMQEQADADLEKDAMTYLEACLRSCPQLADEPDHRLAACTSLAYNIGNGAFSTSTVCRQTAAKNYKLAADAFLLWNKAGGKVLPGLVRRREAERKLYLGG